jgi:hypothetical protein
MPILRVSLGVMPRGETRVDIAALTDVSTALAREGSHVNDEAVLLDLAPDAGSSSDETARGLGGLAASVAGLAEHIGTFASTLNETIADYQASDGRSMEQFNNAGGPA